jgi:hypothetical protein
MPAAPLIYSSGIAGVVATSGATEVVVATVSGVTDRYAGQQIKLWGETLLTTPGSCTSVVCRIRRLTLTGTLVSDQTIQNVITAAAGTNLYGVYATDSPGEVDAFTYVMTVVCTAGVGAGSSVYAVLEARVD